MPSKKPKPLNSNNAIRTNHSAMTMIIAPSWTSSTKCLVWAAIADGTSKRWMDRCSHRQNARPARTPLLHPVLIVSKRFNQQPNNNNNRTTESKNYDHYKTRYQIGGSHRIFYAT